MRVVHPSVYLKQQERKKRRKPRRYATGFLLVVLLGMYGYLAYAVKPEFTVSKIYPQRVTAQELDFAWPESGTASIGYIGASEKVLASKGGKTKLPSASTIKLLTAVVVLNQKPLGPGEEGERIYFTNADVDRMNQIIAEGGVYFPITNGMSMTYRQALEASLISSSNNITDKLAVWAYGSFEAYQKAAISYLSSNGITDTTITDTSGLSAGTTTTADDMLKISLLAMEVSVIKEVVSTTKTQINGIDLTNTNVLLKTDGVSGIKTGYTLEAQNCLLLSKVKVLGNKEFTFVAVVFAQPSRETAFAEANRLLNVLVDNTAITTVVAKRDKVGEVSSPWGSITKFESNGEITIYKWIGEGVEAKVATTPISSGKKGEKIGTAKLRNSEAELVLTEDLPAPSLRWRLLHAFDAVEQII